MGENLIKMIRQFVANKGIIVYSWLLCEIHNDKNVQLTKTDKEDLKRILHKIEKQYNFR